ncbi:hypothetical protein ACFX2I_039940 [Malus domestica]
MPCFSITQSKNSCHRYTFARVGLRSAITDLKNDDTTIHCWVLRSPNPSKPNLLLIHDFGVNVMWQFVDLICHVTFHYNIYVSDLVFFDGSYTTKLDRSEWFQAECVMQAHLVRRLSLVGLSYGRFAGYNLAAMYMETVKKVVICGAAVCLEEKYLWECQEPGLVGYLKAFDDDDGRAVSVSSCSISQMRRASMGRGVELEDD